MMNHEYPELNKIANAIADRTVAQINSKTRMVKSRMPYKAQYVLETVIELLEKRV